MAFLGSFLLEADRAEEFARNTTDLLPQSNRSLGKSRLVRAMAFRNHETPAPILLFGHVLHATRCLSETNDELGHHVEMTTASSFGSMFLTSSVMSREMASSLEQVPADGFMNG